MDLLRSTPAIQWVQGLEVPEVAVGTKMEDKIQHVTAVLAAFPKSVLFLPP